MRQSLKRLLDDVPGSRRVLRHLAALENDLVNKGTEGRFLPASPPDLLKQVLRQLDGLLTAAPPAGLAQLRARLVEAIRSGERAERQAERSQPISSFFVDHKLEVKEVASTDFDRLQADWLAAPPAPSPKS